MIVDHALTAAIERHQGNSDGNIVIRRREEGLYYYYSGKKQTVDVPEDGEYELIAVGGRGGSCHIKSGGYGAEARGRFLLSEGDRLHIAVGGKGGDCNRRVVDFHHAPSETMYSGAGGAGGSFIELEERTSKTRKLLLVGGGGGGAGRHHDGGDGEDGKDGKDGGFGWGGKNGEGGGLSCQDEYSSCDLGFFLIGGAGGGGYEGDGDSRCGTFPSCPIYDYDFNPVRFIALNEREECKKENLLAEGGKSLQNGGEGGREHVDVHETENNFFTTDLGKTIHVRCTSRYLNGGVGGFGGGARGGILYAGEYYPYSATDINSAGHKEVFEHGGGGGGGGYSGGGAGQFQGLGGGG